MQLKSEKKVLEVVTGPLMPKNSLNQNSVGFRFSLFRGWLKATLANTALPLRRLSASNFA